MTTEASQIHARNFYCWIKTQAYQSLYFPRPSPSSFCIRSKFRIFQQPTNLPSPTQMYLLQNKQPCFVPLSSLRRVSTACKHPWQVLLKSLFLQDNWAANPTQPQLWVPTQTGSPPFTLFFSTSYGSLSAKSCYFYYTKMSSILRQLKTEDQKWKKSLSSFQQQF